MSQVKSSCEGLTRLSTAWFTVFAAGRLDARTAKQKKLENALSHLLNYLDVLRKIFLLQVLVNALCFICDRTYNVNKIQNMSKFTYMRPHKFPLSNINEPDHRRLWSCSVWVPHAMKIDDAEPYFQQFCHHDNSCTIYWTVYVDVTSHPGEHVRVLLLTIRIQPILEK